MTATLTPKPVVLTNASKAKTLSTWQQILADSYTRPQDLLRDLQLPSQDVSAHQLFSTRVPRPFADKMQRGDANDPLLLQVMPQRAEFDSPVGFSADPLAEKQFNPLPGLLHKYRSRVLLTLRGACAINCRYCFRRHFDYKDNRVSSTQLAAIVAYIAEHPAINEVVLSGGDPLMAKDSQLEPFITALEALPQLTRLRFHTRLPVVIPERITDEFVHRLSQSRLRGVVVIHCNHPNEIDNNFRQHIKKLREAGVHVLNQSVLLKDINDCAETLIRLSEKLFAADVMPYYLFLLDKVSGAAHFECDEKHAQQLIREVAAQLPGYLVPKLARETAGLASKDMWV